MRSTTDRVVPGAGAAAEPLPASPLFSLRIGTIWRYLLTQPASFWLINIFMFLEYVRPQSIWTALAIAPWSQLTLLGALAASLIEGKLLKFRTAGGIMLVVFSLVLLASCVTALDPGQAYAKLPVYITWVLVFLLITNVVTSEQRFFIFMLAFLLYCLKMSQHAVQAWVTNRFAFVDWGVSGAPGWFENSGEFGIQMCIFLPLVVEFVLALRHQLGPWARRIFYLMPFTAVAGIVASSSRGAVVGAGAVLLWWVARSKQRGRAFVAVGLSLIAMWVLLPPEQKARFATAGEDNTSLSRFERWEAGLEMARRHPALGIGFNNWETYYGPLSHNIFIEAVSELGYTGLAAFVGLIVATFWVNFKTRRLLRRVRMPTHFLRHMAYGLDGALIGYLVSGFFVTVLYYPYFWINLAMTVALHVSARNEVRRLASAGPIVPGHPRNARAIVSGR